MCGANGPYLLGQTQKIRRLSSGHEQLRTCMKGGPELGLRSGDGFESSDGSYDATPIAKAERDCQVAAGRQLVLVKQREKQ